MLRSWAGFGWRAIGCQSKGHREGHGDSSGKTLDPFPLKCFWIPQEIYPGQFQPSLCHKFIALMDKEGKLLRNYTQNIDTLEQVAGIQRIIQCHGKWVWIHLFSLGGFLLVHVTLLELNFLSLNSCLLPTNTLIFKCWQFWFRQLTCLNGKCFQVEITPSRNWAWWSVCEVSVKIHTLLAQA